MTKTIEIHRNEMRNGEFDELLGLTGLKHSDVEKNLPYMACEIENGRIVKAAYGMTEASAAYKLLSMYH